MNSREIDEAEKEMILAMLDKDNWNKILKEYGIHIDIKHFKNPIYKSIYKKLLEGKNRNNMKFELYEEFDFNSISNLLNQSVSSLHIGKIAYNLINYYKMDKTEEILIEYMYKIKKGGDISEIKNWYDLKIKELDIVSIVKNNVVMSHEAMQVFAKQFFEENEYYQTGYPMLDTHLELMKGKVFTIAARSGVGKSSILVNILRNMTNIYNKNIKENLLYALFVSMEMSDAEVAKKYTEIAIGYKEKRGYNKEENKQYILNNPDIIEKGINSNKYILIADCGKLYLSEIENMIIEQKKTRKNLSIVGVDYLQMVKSDKKNKYEQIAEVALELKPLAKKHNVLLIMLTQTNRQEGGSGNNKINLTALKGAGEIEDGSNVVLSVYMDENYDCLRYYDVIKNRDGTKGGHMVTSNWNTYFKQLNNAEVQSEKDDYDDRKRSQQI